MDPRVGGLVLEHMNKIKKISLWSDFCDQNQLDTYYDQVVLGGRKDPAQNAIDGKEKKVSHSTVEIGHVLLGAV